MTQHTMKPSELVAALVTAAADHTGLDALQIVGSGRATDLCEARWACYIVLYSKGWTLQRIGLAFRRDHTTVLHGIERAKDYRGIKGDYFRALCEAVREGVEGILPKNPAPHKMDGSQTPCRGSNGT